MIAAVWGAADSAGSAWAGEPTGATSNPVAIGPSAAGSAGVASGVPAPGAVSRRVAPPPPPPPPPLLLDSQTSSEPRSSEFAASLAQRLGMAYQDGGSYVLLSDAVCRVRVYPGTHVISLDGDDQTLRGLMSRELQGILIPGPAAGIIERHVFSVRALRGSPAPVAAPAMPAVSPRVPVRPVPVAPATAVAPVAPRASVVMPDPQWVVAPTARPWRWIVLHHSDDLSGCVAKYNQVHLDKGWENGCGYHFVVGNGSQSGDGEVEVSNRWRLQQQGAHAKTPDNQFNEHGIGICLVGDFEHGAGRPTAAQMRSLARLVQWLMDRYEISSVNVRGHCHCKSTCCPGKNFPWAELRSRLREPASRMLAQAPAVPAWTAGGAAPQALASAPAAARLPPSFPRATPPAPRPPALGGPPITVAPTSTLGVPPAGPLPEPMPVAR